MKCMHSMIIKILLKFLLVVQSSPEVNVKVEELPHTQAQGGQNEILQTETSETH